jgi:hypothetical protein
MKMHETIESEMYMDVNGTAVVIIRSVKIEGCAAMKGSVLIG